MRLRERYEMSNCPCHHIAAAFEVSLAALRRTQHRCDVSSDGRLFGNYRSGQCLSAAICCRKSARRCLVESLFGRPGQPNPGSIPFEAQSGGVVVCDENTGTAEVVTPQSGAFPSLPYPVTVNATYPGNGNTTIAGTAQLTITAQ